MMRFPSQKVPSDPTVCSVNGCLLADNNHIDSLLRLNGTPHFQKHFYCGGGISGASQEAACYCRDATLEISKDDARCASRPHACRVESYNARYRNETERNRNLV